MIIIISKHTNTADTIVSNKYDPQEFHIKYIHTFDSFIHKILRAAGKMLRIISIHHFISNIRSSLLNFILFLSKKYII